MGVRLLNSIMKRMFLNALLDKLKHAIVECRVTRVRLNEAALVGKRTVVGALDQRPIDR
jgi:hypothetical protein